VAGGVTALAAIPLGVVALSQIKASGGRQKGRGMAIAGISLGSALILLVVALVLAVILLADTGDDGFDASPTTFTLPEDETEIETGPATPEPPGPGASITGATPCPTVGGEGVERTTSFAQAPPTCIDPASTYTATFDTTQGEVVVTLDAATAPTAVNSYVVLADHGYYDGTALFRTDPSIGIVQGGAPLTNSPSDPGPGYTIPDEGSTFTYRPGQLVMARSAGADSTGGQYFFVVTSSASALDSQGNYIVIGETDAAGLEVLEAILDLHVADAGNPLGGGPSDAVIVDDVTVEQG
jgi:peptidyl-prolyl cis-trans isomerase B (cyclophilin B)